MNYSTNSKLRKFYLKTMGCQMNEHDSETIIGILTGLNFIPTDDYKKADLILYNTCCVRDNPVRKVYGHINSFKSLKEQKPDLIIGICGCMTQHKQELENIKERLPHVDLIFGTHNIYRLPELMKRVDNGERVIEVWDEAEDMVENLPVKRGHSIKAFVNIIYGCTNYCSYCIVPYTRGRERSREPEAIVSEVKNLARIGYKEITLLGQNVNAYGKDIALDIDFAGLLTILNEIPGIERIRFMTSHPKDMKDNLIEAMATLPKVCEHLHLPVQAGSDRILKMMNRGYTRSYYLKLVRKLREAIGNISLTTDLIVGFPGETEEDFQQTLALVEEVGFSSAFTFIYSPRSGTPAAKMQEQIPEDVKKQRIYKLIELQNKISLNHMQSLVGETIELLVDEYMPESNLLSGRTRTNKQILFSGSPDLISKLVQIKITEAKTWSLRGQLI
ncbi:MAG: tRNA (N6-isopentenyl adenosine(37)-C2)-methylthiotransferase MiaB [Firmicutes bacterium]|nr:tRNA (N6-isopentenyl adenosine(37)-C2)-methylthiotransferase MiaB [Bacillota bacterium]